MINNTATKNVISREQAIQLVPDYVHWIETQDWETLVGKIMPPFRGLKRGAKVIGYFNGQFIKATVTSVKDPVVKISNGEFDWRIDNAKYAAPFK